MKIYCLFCIRSRLYGIKGVAQGMVYCIIGCGVASTASPSAFFDPFRGYGHDRTIWLQNFQRISQAELAALGAMGNAVFPRIHSADEIPISHISMAGRLQGFLFAKIETG